MRLSDLERPFICTSVTETTVPETIRTIKKAEYAGANAFEIHLPLLDFPDSNSIQSIVNATANPIYATCRRGGFYKLLGVEEPVTITDRERTEQLLRAVEEGFDGVDIELDTFDPQPGPDDFSPEAIEAYATNDNLPLSEITDDEEAIAAQESFINKIHTKDGEVILSAHTYKHLNPSSAVKIGERISNRNGDFAKIVGVDRTMDDALDTLRSHLHLNESETPPYSLMAIGEPSRIIRPIAPAFGSAWVFAQPELTPDGFHSWPLIENAREILRRIDWRTAYNPHYR